MIIVDKQINALCHGIIPRNIVSYYKFMGVFLDPNIEQLVTPYDPALVNPASLDIRIGESAKLRIKEGLLTKLLRKRDNLWIELVNLRSAFIPDYIPEKKYKEIDISLYSESKPYMMQPGDRMLIGSLETINLPPFLTAQFKLKSSRGREWYGHQLAGYCDPRWNGSVLTMELTNDDLDPLPLYPGLKIGQMIFSLTFGLPDKDYSVTGRYNNDVTVSGSKG